MPARREWTGLSLPVADDARNDQVGIVEGGAVGVRERVAQLSAFVNRPRCFRRHVAGNPRRKRELRKEPLQSNLVPRDVGVHLAVGTLEICVGHERRTAVTGPGNVDHREIPFPDDAVQMNVDEIQTRSRSPVTEQPRLDVFRSERLLQ